MMISAMMLGSRRGVDGAHAPWGCDATPRWRANELTARAWARRWPLAGARMRGKLMEV